jgi:hypothetical protein
MADRETDFFVTSEIGIKLNLLNYLDKKGFNFMKLNLNVNFEKLSF